MVCMDVLYRRVRRGFSRRNEVVTIQYKTCIVPYQTCTSHSEVLKNESLRKACARRPFLLSETEKCTVGYGVFILLYNAIAKTHHAINTHSRTGISDHTYPSPYIIDQLFN